MPPAARKDDLVLQDVLSHCHTLHPNGAAANPEPHPATSLKIVGPCSWNVEFEGQAAARVTDMTEPCNLKGCVPAGPGIIAIGSFTVLINDLPAARAGDSTAHATCVASIPSPKGTILRPCSTSVDIGG